MIDPLAVSATAATALGAYNIARFAATKAVEKRRKIKEARQLAADVRAAIKFAKGAYEAVSDGIDAEELKKIRAIADAVKASLAEPTPEATTKKAAA